MNEQDKHTDLCHEATFKRFYLEFIQAAKNFAFYKCGDEQEALDLTQEAFVKIWNRCNNIEFKKAKTYLFTTINNSFLNAVKHKKVVLNYQRNQASEESESNEDPQFILREKEFKKTLNSAIASLTEAQREVFLLNRIDGKKYAEIAEMLNISVKAVEKRMSQALKNLRQQIPEF
ncbi:RNA polymerase sigma factor [Leeuwenhoekiella palythoae]|uniref:RNA polymerase sigma-70 factor (ECF subfamily) n=1 Tax=Leeuwenhoekiella palythoae TaxID=573501 RepID=A0A1M5Z9J8_9FLAO|nr:RNA polymerase sigma-70 factor [Leeuwenhoekiella palythoae]RXG28130.1 RNA polymerase sigma-70 factor (ECF subfamily) [Leeuwenhoekiella palythoae]SHI20894.1 RNA polymerase sigma-70 factor, ECF subfamily [Leeuwenhoekiella palythoae]